MAVVWRKKSKVFNSNLEKKIIESNIEIEKFEEIFINGDSIIKNAISIGALFNEKMFNY